MTTVEANVLIGTSSSRVDGLVLLRDVIINSEANEVQSKALIWINTCLRLLEVPAPSMVHVGALLCVRSVFERASILPEVKRECSTAIPTLIDICSKNDTASQLSKCRSTVLYTLIQHYPSSCGSHVRKLSESLLWLLKQQDELVCQVSRAAWARLCLCSGNQPQRHVNQWTNQVNSVLNHLSATGARLLEDFPVIEGGDFPLELPEIPDDIRKRQQKLATRIKDMMLLLESLLGVRVSGAVQLPLHKILQLIVAICSHNPWLLLRQETREKKEMFWLLLELQTSCVQLLAHVIKTCGSLLLSQNSVVNQLLVQLLDWCHSAPAKRHSRSSVVCGLQVAVYKLLATWLQYAAAGSCLDSRVSQLLRWAVGDLLPQKNSSVPSKSPAKSPARRGKGKQKRDKTRGYNSNDVMSELGDVGAWPSLSLHVQLTVSALNVVSRLADVFCTTVDSEKLFMNAAVNPLISVLSHPPSEPRWSSAEVRLAVYRALGSLMLTCCPARLQQLHFLLRRSALDPCDQLSVQCSRLLLDVESVVHPRLPTTPRTSQQVTDDVRLSPAQSPTLMDSEAVESQIPGYTNVTLLQSHEPESVGAVEDQQTSGDEARNVDEAMNSSPEVIQVEETREADDVIELDDNADDVDDVITITEETTGDLYQESPDKYSGEQPNGTAPDRAASVHEEDSVSTEELKRKRPLEDVTSDVHEPQTDRLGKRAKGDAREADLPVDDSSTSGDDLANQLLADFVAGDPDA